MYTMSVQGNNFLWGNTILSLAALINRERLYEENFSAGDNARWLFSLLRSVALSVFVYRSAAALARFSVRALSRAGLCAINLLF
jgi:hypothetical protein